MSSSRYHRYSALFNDAVFYAVSKEAGDGIIQENILNTKTGVMLLKKWIITTRANIKCYRIRYGEPTHSKRCIHIMAPGHDELITRFNVFNVFSVDLCANLLENWL